MKRPSTPGTTANLSDSAGKHLNMYALAAGAAGVSLLALAQPAEGKIVYTPANERIRGTYDLDLDHDGITDFTLNLSGFNDCSIRRLFETAAPLNDAVGSAGQAAALGYGVRIGKGDHFLPGNLLMLQIKLTGDFFCIYEGRQGSWFDTAAYLGLKFRIHGKTHYGWARLTVRVDGYPVSYSVHATLTGYAYETIPGEAIIAGKTHSPENDLVPDASPTNPIPDIPQPASLGRLSLGAQGVPLWRREEEVEAAK